MFFLNNKVDFLFLIKTQAEDIYCKLIICAHNKCVSHLFLVRNVGT